MDIVIFLSYPSQSCTDLFSLLITELPRWYHIVWFQKCITWNKVVLCTEVVISNKGNILIRIIFEFKYVRMKSENI